MPNLNTSMLVYKTKEELLQLIEDELGFVRDEPQDEDVLYYALENIEQVVYVLKNCDYEGKE